MQWLFLQSYCHRWKRSHEAITRSPQILSLSLLQLSVMMLYSTGNSVCQKESKGSHSKTLRWRNYQTFNAKAVIPSSSNSNMYSRTKDLVNYEKSKAAKEEISKSSSMSITALMCTLYKHYNLLMLDHECYDLAKQLSHYLYFFSFSLLHRKEYGKVSCHKCHSVTWIGSYIVTSHDKSHDRSGEIVHRPYSSCISSI